MADKVALVTGASRGTGAATARALAADGSAEVVQADLSDPAAPPALAAQLVIVAIHTPFVSSPAAGSG
ncbi:MAG: hypothetical protein QM676_12760 [Novosphingobium sp.]